MTGGRRSADGFEEAFDRLFPRAFRLARRIVGDPASAEDVAAESLARAYAQWPRVSSLPHCDGWVLRVAANLAIDHVRRHPPRLEPTEAADAEELLTLRMALAAALVSLPRRQRQAVTLRYLAELSEAEVAVALGISSGSVKTHVHRGLTALRRRLGPGVEEVVPVGMAG